MAVLKVSKISERKAAKIILSQTLLISTSKLILKGIEIIS